MGGLTKFEKYITNNHHITHTLSSKPKYG